LINNLYVKYFNIKNIILLSFSDRFIYEFKLISNNLELQLRDSRLFFLENLSINTKKSIFKIYIIKLLFNKFYFIKFMFNSFFSRYTYLIAVGLGFRRKKRIKRGRKFLELYMGGRHRLYYFIPQNVFLVKFKNSHIILFSSDKKNLILPLALFRNFKKELLFKLKGCFNRRIRMKRRITRN